MAMPALTYDLTVLLNPDLDDDRREKMLEDIEHLITDNGGEVVERHDWGVRQTAYEIRKRADQDYHLIQFHATTEALAALDHTLKITDGVSRFRIIKLRHGTPAAPDLSAATAVPAAAGGERSDEDE